MIQRSPHQRSLTTKQIDHYLAISKHCKPARKDQNHIRDLTHIPQDHRQDGGNGCKHQRYYHHTGKLLPRIPLPENMLTQYRKNGHNHGNGKTPLIVKTDLRWRWILHKKPANNRRTRPQNNHQTQNQQQHRSGKRHKLTTQNFRLFLG